jgi:hypothetical protein
MGEWGNVEMGEWGDGVVGRTLEYCHWSLVIGHLESFEELSLVIGGALKNFHWSLVSLRVSEKGYKAKNQWGRMDCELNSYVVHMNYR